MSNGSAIGGRVSHADTRAQMDAFDRLPPAVRAELAGAAFNWAPFPILARIRRGAYNPLRRGGVAAIVKDIRRWDRDEIRRGPRRR